MQIRYPVAIFALAIPIAACSSPVEPVARAAPEPATATITATTTTVAQTTTVAETTTTEAPTTTGAPTTTLDPTEVGKLAYFVISSELNAVWADLEARYPSLGSSNVRDYCREFAQNEEAWAQRLSAADWPVDAQDEIDQQIAASALTTNVRAF
jgi:hypothetical protein